MPDFASPRSNVCTSEQRLRLPPLRLFPAAWSLFFSKRIQESSLAVESGTLAVGRGE
jgi:hypothetical protein